MPAFVVDKDFYQTSPLQACSRRLNRISR